MIEVVIATTILAVVIALASASMVQGTDAASAQTVKDELRQRCERAMDQVARRFQNTVIERAKATEVDVRFFEYEQEADVDSDGDRDGWDQATGEPAFESASETVIYLSGDELFLVRNRGNLANVSEPGDLRVGLTSDVTEFAFRSVGGASLPVDLSILGDFMDLSDTGVQTFSITLTLTKQIGRHNNPDGSGTPWTVTATAERVIHLHEDPSDDAFVP